MNYQLKFKERRLSERKTLTGLLPGRMQLKGKDLSCRPLDVSQQGMGILCATELTVGATLDLIIKDQNVKLQVAWSQEDFSKKNLWRYGLVTTDATNIEELFIATGCLRSSSAGP